MGTLTCHGRTYSKPEAEGNVKTITRNGGYQVEYWFRLRRVDWKIVASD
jgi:hypothetical protein